MIGLCRFEMRENPNLFHEDCKTKESAQDGFCVRLFCMIYLIGGAPRCGKTLLSRALATKKHVPWMSIDVFRSGVVAYIPQDQIKNKLPDDNIRLETSTPKELLESEILESKTLWPGVRSIIEHLIKGGQEYIIEGVQLMPELVQELVETAYWKQIRLVYLVKEDLAEIKEGFPRNKSEHDWLKEALTNTDLVERAARMVEMKSRYITEQAKKYGFMVVDTGKDFERKLTKLVNGF